MVFQVEFDILLVLLEILKSSFKVRNYERDISNENFLKNTQRYSIKIDIFLMFLLEPVVSHLDNVSCL